MRIFILLVIYGLSLSCWSSQKTTPSPSNRPSTGTVSAPSPKIDTIIALKTVDYDTTQWLELIDLDSTIVLDLKYATEDNFVKTQMYDCPRCFLRPVAAKALVKAHQALKSKGYRLKLFDCYRPRPIQWELWKKVPNPKYVADPKKGSMHNRGTAVDLTIVDATGKELDMGTPFDYFGQEAHHAYTALPKAVLDNRKLLKTTLAAFQFGAIKTEWWHYSYRAQSFELSDMLWACPTK